MIYRLDTKVIWDELHSQHCPVFICAFSHLDKFYSSFISFDYCNVEFFYVKKFSLTSTPIRMETFEDVKP